MKAQVVKNTIIVPTGAKGGFYPKRPPIGDREAVLNNAVACYRTFVSGLLDLTDNVLASADVVVIITQHDAVDYDRVVAHAGRIYDTRNATRGVREQREKIRKL